MNKYKTIRQHDSKDCGAACLCMISNYFGSNYSLQQLRKITCTSQDGVSILGLIEGAEEIGLSAKSYKGKIEDLKAYINNNNNPIIFHLKRNHFVVGYKAEKIFINDPAKGKCKYTWKML